MYRTILVPLDGSKRAEAILPHVESLARCDDAVVILLQVIQPVFPSAGLEGIYAALPAVFEQQTEQAESYLAEVQARLKEKGIKAETRVAFGAFVEEIINTAEAESADLIAMASHGRGGLSRVFYGSVAAGMLHRVDRPLLLVRAQDEP